MSLLYASPFLAVAAAVFFLCAGIPALRRHALVVPFGVLAFGVGALASDITTVLVANHLGRSAPATLVLVIAGGCCIALVGSLVYREVVARLPILLIRLGLAAASACSSVVILISLNLWLTSDPRANVVARVIAAIGAVGLTIWIAMHPEQFRPHPIFRRNFSRRPGAQPPAPYPKP